MTFKFNLPQTPWIVSEFEWDQIKMKNLGSNFQSICLTILYKFIGKEQRRKELKKNKKQRMAVRHAVLKGKDGQKILFDLDELDDMGKTFWDQ